jgi:predicted phage terminase large subunit-like protein
MDVNQIRPQPGPQERALACSADILIYGGSAGSGKTAALLLEPLRHIHNPAFSAVIFRRTYSQISNAGGLWDAALNLYPLLGAIPKQAYREFWFPPGSKVTMRHLHRDSDRIAWQGTEIPLVSFDELTHFSDGQFWYLLSRNRSTCGVRPYMRATCNPDADSWVRDLIDWWIDDDGYIIPARSGVLRWLTRDGDRILWSDEPKENYKSFTFIEGSIYDNPILLSKDPGYLASLQALPLVERMRLLERNWNVKAVAGFLFQSAWIEIVDSPPSGSSPCRFWDFAASAAGDWSVGIKGYSYGDIVYVSDVCRIQVTPEQLNQSLVNIASQDQCPQYWWRDPGQAGVHQDSTLRSLLSPFGIPCGGFISTATKVQRANSASAAAEQGRIKLKRAPWNSVFLNELQQFPDGKHDDQVDALSGLVYMLSGHRRFGQGKATW